MVIVIFQSRMVKNIVNFDSIKWIALGFEIEASKDLK